MVIYLIETYVLIAKEYCVLNFTNGHSYRFSKVKEKLQPVELNRQRRLFETIAVAVKTTAIRERD